MKIEHLAWDSNFFGMTVGRLVLDAQGDVSSIAQKLTESSFDVVYLLLDQPTDERIQQIQMLAPLYDRKVTFGKAVLTVESQSNHDIYCYEGLASKELKELTLLSGEYSRFNLDLKFRSFFGRLYTEWIEKSLSGEMADAVYVARSRQKLSGFITLSKNNGVGQIGLIAVHPDARGQGIASSLLSCANEWQSGQGCTKAIVVTQRDNFPACQLYEKNGYKINSETAIFHWWRT